MEAATFGGTAPMLGPRINLRSVDDMPVPNRLSKREDCTSSQSGDTCEKPGGGTDLAMPIALGVVIPLAVALVVLFYLHRRNVRRQRAEDAKDPLKDMDFGVDHVPIKGGKRKSMFGGEKIVHRPGQLSMDMNLSSPYLLPPGNHSKDSLAQGFPDAHDPYRMVHSETNSIRSFGAGKEGSLYGGSSRHTSVAGRSLAGNRFPPPPRQNSLPRSPATPSSRNDPFATPPPSEPAPSVTKEEGFKDSQFPMQPVVPEIGHIGQAESHDAPQVRSPPAIMPKDPQERTQSPPMSPPPHAKPAEVQDGPIGMAYPGEDFPLPPAQTQQQHAGFNLDLDVPKPLSPPVGIAVQHDDGHDYHDNQPQIRTSEYYDEPQEFDRGMAPQRQASLGYEQPPPQQEGLGVPQQDNKRLSVGFRPLPPAEELESEDPEYRANRIRSFYKEYFDDSKDNAPPVPAMPQYYEDYDESYLGDAAYYDADTNAFVMPYAQPVTRRAMTPPPAGRLRPGGPGPRPGPRPRGPHGPHGSLGGMSLPGGPRGRSRAGSAFGPRPGSSASARMGRPGPKKKLPPPAALSTLPTPSKLKDDSFAILNAIDFAPPDSYQERNRGRSQSPLGERRPYNPQLPVASPLVSAFDEMASLPSPHLLRKSNTFTNLDFAPPKKFKNEDTMSDAGSIRSNNSGISSTNLSAIRGGAGRVSRLPGDQVFTQAALGGQLKPQWGMRQM